MSFDEGASNVHCRHDDDSHRLRPMLDRQAGPRWPSSRHWSELGCRPGAHLHRPWAERHEPRPAGLDQAMAASALSATTLVVPKLDRLARSVPDARAIADSLVARGVRLALCVSVYDPADPMGKMFFNIWRPSPSSRAT